MTKSLLCAAVPAEDRSLTAVYRVRINAPCVSFDHSFPLYLYAVFLFVSSEEHGPLCEKKQCASAEAELAEGAEEGEPGIKIGAPAAFLICGVD